MCEYLFFLFGAILTGCSLTSPHFEKSSWAKINTALIKFSAIHDKIVRFHGSGTSPADWLRQAKELYATQTATKKKDGTSKPNPFKYESSWELLRLEPKFLPPPTSVSLSTVEVPSFETALTNGDEIDPDVSIEAKPHRAPSPERPLGGKSAKRARLAQAKEDVAQAAKLEREQDAAKLAERRVLAMEGHNEISKEKMALEKDAADMRILSMNIDAMPDEGSKAALRARKAIIIKRMTSESERK